MAFRPTGPAGGVHHHGYTQDPHRQSVYQSQHNPGYWSGGGGSSTFFQPQFREHGALGTANTSPHNHNPPVGYAQAPPPPHPPHQQQSFISILPFRLRLVTFPKIYLASVMHPIVKNLFFTKHQNFFSFTENSWEISIIAEASVVQDFPNPSEHPWLSVSEDLFRALQIDSEHGVETSGKRISDLSAPLAQAGISIFYLSTYLTDFIFVSASCLKVHSPFHRPHRLLRNLKVKEKRLPLVISTLRGRNFTFIDDSQTLLNLVGVAAPTDLAQNPPTPSPLNADTTWLSFRAEMGQALPGVDAIPVPPNSSSFDPSPASSSPTHPAAAAADETSSSSAQSSGSGSYQRRPESLRVPPPELLADARMLDKKLLDTPPLRLVGLNKESMESWGMQIMKVLFYSGTSGRAAKKGNDRGEKEKKDVEREADREEAEAMGSTATLSGTGAVGEDHVDGREAGKGKRAMEDADADWNRFFSYTVTEEGISLVADETILEGLADHHLFTSSELTNLRCIQVDLKDYGLDRYGIVWSMSQPLVTNGINLLYLSTASAANVLVDESDLTKSLHILEVMKDQQRNRPGPPPEDSNQNAPDPFSSSKQGGRGAGDGQRDPEADGREAPHSDSGLPHRQHALHRGPTEDAGAHFDAFFGPVGSWRVTVPTQPRSDRSLDAPAPRMRCVSGGSSSMNASSAADDGLSSSFPTRSSFTPTDASGSPLSSTPPHPYHPHHRHRVGGGEGTAGIARVPSWYDDGVGSSAGTAGDLTPRPSSSSYASTSSAASASASAASSFGIPAAASVGNRRGPGWEWDRTMSARSSVGGGGEMRPRSVSRGSNLRDSRKGFPSISTLDGDGGEEPAEDEARLARVGYVPFDDTDDNGKLLNGENASRRRHPHQDPLEYFFGQDGEIDVENADGGNRRPSEGVERAHLLALGISKREARLLRNLPPRASFSSSSSEGEAEREMGYEAEEEGEGEDEEEEEDEGADEWKPSLGRRKLAPSPASMAGMGFGPGGTLKGRNRRPAEQVSDAAADALPPTATASAAKQHHLAPEGIGAPSGASGAASWPSSPASRPGSVARSSMASSITARNSDDRADAASAAAASKSTPTLLVGRLAGDDDPANAAGGGTPKPTATPRSESAPSTPRTMHLGNVFSRVSVTGGPAATPTATTPAAPAAAASGTGSGGHWFHLGAVGGAAMGFWGWGVGKRTASTASITGRMEASGSNGTVAAEGCEEVIRV
ncbi:hypothetical protein HDU96_008615 [Phlyctochytrium bullatum]|nr:hypothetical protein HDU96_008615 [Phlyctochytrium bullatum]